MLLLYTTERCQKDDCLYKVVRRCIKQEIIHEDLKMIFPEILSDDQVIHAKI